jgi:hypothetical protein
MKTTQKGKGGLGRSLARFTHMEISIQWMII